tara:strand:- start:933 stop:1352 length:420 start_codon:yes stop_codon:yes gene_type:complete
MFKQYNQRYYRSDKAVAARLLRKQQGYYKGRAYKKRQKQIDAIKLAYGLSEEQYLAMFEAQDHKCSICLTKVEPWSRLTHIDHDKTKEYAPARCHPDAVRGILCSLCNPGLGMFKHDSAALLKAAAYINGSQQLLQQQQ